MQIEKNIAATLRHRMEAEKKSKLEFSKELGIPRSTFQGYLKGENCLRSDSIEEIAKGLNITPAQLISGPEDAAAESLRLETLLPQIPALHPQAQRLAKLCTTQQLDPVHLFDVIHDFLDQEAASV